MNESPCVRGMLRVDLGDDRLGQLRRRLGVVDRDAERAEAVLVRRRDVDEHHVRRQVALAEQPGDLVEEDGDVVAAAVADGLARARRRTNSDLWKKDSAYSGLAYSPLPMATMWLISTSLEVGGASDERVDQVERLAAGVREHDTVAGLDDLQRLGGADDLLRVVGLPVHPHSLLQLVAR